MGGVSILYLMMSGFMGTLTEEGPLPSVALAVGLVLLFVVLSLVTHLQQYKATYGLVYNLSLIHILLVSSEYLSSYSNRNNC